MNHLKELVRYRYMMYSLVRKDLRTRYKGSFLGFLWTFINPLLQLIIYSVVFSVIMRVDVENFSMFLFVALIPWLFFSSSIQLSSACIVVNKELIKKIYFPRLVIPISVVNGAFMNMIFSMIVVLIALVVTGIGLSVYILYLPIVMMLEYLLVLGMSFILSSINVYFRDIEHILGIVVMGWFYLTPIVYTVDMVPDQFLALYYLNPMTAIIMAYRDILYYQKSPEFLNFGMIAIVSIGMIVIGYMIFQKLQKGFAEEL